MQSRNIKIRRSSQLFIWPPLCSDYWRTNAALVLWYGDRTQTC